MSDDLSDLMLRLKKQLGLTSLVVTHDLDLMYKVAGQVVFLYEGRVIFFGPPADWRSRIIRACGSFWRWTGWRRDRIVRANLGKMKE
jgi:ABC-type transporter Mla maintaining outer membrane lipid asymmetry ATPase subunit MlaF